MSNINDDHSKMNGHLKSISKTIQMKVFLNRESPITNLLEVKHFKTVKHVFFVLLFGFLTRDVVCAVTNASENVNFGFSMIRASFSNFHLVLVFWTALFTINLITYAVYKFWAEYRKNWKPKSTFVVIWDTFFTTALILYYFISLATVPFIVGNYLNLGLASAMAILTENVRFLMKSHAFIRSITPDVLNYKPHSDKELNIPTLSNYLYFSFAPVLVYRREYPRTKEVNARRAIVYFSEVLFTIWLQSYIFEAFFVKPFKFLEKSEVNWNRVAVIAVESSIGGLTMMVLNFYLILHAWLNTWAELLRFADRKFYEDWWNCTNFSTYFRTWNIVVHDWLYEYVYKDFYQYIVPNNKLVAKLLVFLISAVIHEYLVTFFIGHFLPTLFISFFVFGLTFTFLDTKHEVYNIFFLYGLGLGTSIQISLHIIEYYARERCSYTDNTLHLIPRFISKDCS